MEANVNGVSSILSSNSSSKKDMKLGFIQCRCAAINFLSEDVLDSDLHADIHRCMMYNMFNPADHRTLVLHLEVAEMQRKSVVSPCVVKISIALLSN